MWSSQLEYASGFQFDVFNLQSSCSHPLGIVGKSLFVSQSCTSIANWELLVRYARQQHGTSLLASKMGLGVLK